MAGMTGAKASKRQRVKASLRQSSTTAQAHGAFRTKASTGASTGHAYITGMKNTDFGSYNIFRFKGSFNCRHYWLRRLYVLKKAPRAMTIDGKVYQKGEYLPKDLKNYKPRNKGYVPSDAGVPAPKSDEKAASKINQKVVR